MIRIMNRRGFIGGVAASAILGRRAAAQFVLSPGVSTAALASTETPGGLLNVNATTLPHWRAAMARVRAGTGRARLMLVGDSTTVGAGSGTSGGTNLNGAWPKAVGRNIATLLGQSVAVNDRAFFGDQNVLGQTTYPSYDTRVTAGAGWFTGTFLISFGGNVVRYSTGSATALAFTPTGSFDNFKIWYIRNSGHGSFTYNIDGGASLGTINCNGASTMLSQANTATLGAHTINIVANNDATFLIIGIEAWNSTVPAVDILQGGSFGSTAATWNQTGSAWSPPTVMSGLSPDLTIINLTINDSNANAALSAYQANIQALITAGLVTGDVLLMVGAPSNTPQATNGTLDSYVAALRSLALTNNSGLLNLKTRWVSYAATNPILPYFDAVHPGATGYQDIAQAITEVLR